MAQVRLRLLANPAVTPAVASPAACPRSGPSERGLAGETWRLSLTGANVGGNIGADTWPPRAAILVREQVLTEIGANIENPGVLYATMLLMGDRCTGPTTFTSIGYDDTWGAGSLKVRMLNADGLDGPAAYRAGSVCVGDGETVRVLIDPSGSGAPEVLSTDVDVLKLVTWTYSKGHDNEGSGEGVVPDVHLGLQRLYLPGVWQSDIADSSGDHKKRLVKLGGVGGEAWRFSLTGVDVGANTGADKWPTCAAGRVRVWYAWLVEDDDREPGDVPTCVGSEVTP